MHFFTLLFGQNRIVSNFESRKEKVLKELIAKINKKIYIKLDLSRLAYKCQRLYQLFNFIYILIKVPTPDK